MRVLCVGEMLVDIIARPVEKVSFQNDTLQIKDIQITSGGDANNNAINFAKLGCDVTYIGRIGFDQMGDYVKKIAEEAHVDMAHAVRSTSAPQAKSLVMVNPAGERTFLQCPGASAEFCFEDCDLSLLEQTDILQIGGAFHLPKFDGNGTARLLQAAKRQGVITSMDVTTDRTNRWKGILDPAYSFLDYFLPSIEQAAMIAGTDSPEEIAAYFISRGVKNVAVKLGSRGSYFQNEHTAFYAGTYKDLTVVETTGAGDAFCAGFLTGVGKGFQPEMCVTLATACSAFAIQALGATAGLRDYDTTLRFIDTHPPLDIRRKY